MAIYDRYKPFVVGNSFTPLAEGAAVLDTGSELGYQFIATENFYSAVNGVTMARLITTQPPPGVPDRSEIVFRLYQNDPLLTCTPVQKLIIPCSAGSGGAIGGGAATRQDAVANPSDPYYVRLSGAAQTARFWFGTNTAAVQAAFNIWHVEILDVSVVYSISGPFATATTNTMSCGMERQAGPVKRYMDYLVTGPSASSSITETRRSRFGELCPFWDSGTNPNTEYMRGPWVYQGYDDIGLYALSGAGVDDVAVFFETGSGAAGDYDIHYVGLEVTYRENFHLIGVGGLDLSGGIEIAEGLYSYRSPIMPADYPWAYTSGGAVSVIALSEGQRYTITVSRAYSGSVSVASPVPLPVSTINTIKQNVPFLNGVKITKPIAERAIPTYTETTEFPSIVIYDASIASLLADMTPAHVNPACHGYEQQMPQMLHDAGYFYAEQQIPNDTAGTFAWATFYARASESVSGGLYVEQTDGAGTSLGPRGYISYEDWALLPEITDGWRKVTVPLSPVAVLTGAGGVTYWQFWTSSLELQVWEVLGATANHTTAATGASSGAVAGYHGETAVANFQGTANYPLDLTIELAQEMSTVSSSATTSYKSSGTVSHADNASVNPLLPGGWAPGDLFVMIAAIRVITGRPVCPAGWTTLVDGGNIAVFGKIAAIGESNPTVTFSGGVAGASCSAQISAFSGAYLTVLASATQANASAQNIAVPALTVNSNGPALMLWAGWKADDVTGTTGGPGILAFGSSTTLGADQYIGLRYSIVHAGVTTVDASTITVSGGVSEISAGVTLALTINPAFTVIPMLQALSVVDDYCALPVDSIPTGIVYNHLAWEPVLSSMVSGWGYYEIQRRDTTMDAGVWETIAKITTPYIGEMDDYEARIGVESTYRIRTVHTTGILGPWSASVSSMLLTPGVTGSECDVGLLSFTSNEHPDGNLAYVHIHGSGDSEDFTFVEAGQQSLEPVFRRDYQVALRPTERGGVTFSRTVLVNKVGIPTGTLDRGFSGLRDLAWDSVPYVCVRDELGNRWLSNINVPSGSIRRHDYRRTHYQVAQLTITEVTGVPQVLDIPEPYLGLTGLPNADFVAYASPLSALATLEDVDISMKIIVKSSWWSAWQHRSDTGPPESWWGLYTDGYSGGELGFQTSGDDGFFYSDVPFVPIINQPTWVRCVYDHDAGGGAASTATFYSSLDGVTWTSLGLVTDTPAGLVPGTGGTFYAAATDKTIIQELRVINTATNTLIMCPDFSAQTASTTSFVDACGVQWDIAPW